MHPNMQLCTHCLFIIVHICQPVLFSGNFWCTRCKVVVTYLLFTKLINISRNFASELSQIAETLHLKLNLYLFRRIWTRYESYRKFTTWNFGHSLSNCLTGKFSFFSKIISDISKFLMQLTLLPYPEKCTYIYTFLYVP